MRPPSPPRRLALLFACTLSGAGAASLLQDEEPPLRLTLEMAGQKLDVELGKPFEIELGGRKVTAKLSAQPTRRFAAAGVEFDYPRQLSFEVDRDDPNVTMWSLSGNDALVMVQQYERTDSAALLSSVVDATAEYYRDAEVEKSRTSIELGGIKSDGQRLSVVMAGTRLRQDFYPIQLRGGSVVLMLQDTLGDDGAVSEESTQVRDVLSKTFKLAQ